jgi:hypothetical protein
MQNFSISFILNITGQSEGTIVIPEAGDKIGNFVFIDG